jgi:DUF917 family protein
LLVAGKITDVQRTTSEGFARGNLSIDGAGRWDGQAMAIDFQNENLIARVGGCVAACVPDLICCLESAGALPKGLNPRGACSVRRVLAGVVSM